VRKTFKVAKSQPRDGREKQGGNDRASRTGLGRALSKLGYCSRTRAIQLVHAGHVTVNGTRRIDPEFPVRMSIDRIQVADQELHAAPALYLAMNKPRGLVTTAADEKGRATVYDLLPRDTPWVGPVGRLDKASEGLLLLTNDTEWAARITDPQSHLAKTYHVQIASSAPETLVSTILAGIRHDQELLRVRSAAVLRRGAKNSWLEIVLDEGRNRHIRRVFAALGIEVLRLVRVSIGPLALGDLPKGEVRALSEQEKTALDTAPAVGNTSRRSTPHENRKGR
jgi:23S rRNA pseudouridine2605 synthase